jgi:hypothetical protein
VLSELLGGLDELRDDARARPWEAVGRYRFGARDLAVHATRTADLPADALAPWGGGSESRLFVVERADVDRLRFPTDAVLAPYGALVESSSTDWLVLRSPDTGKMLALDRRTRDALYFPGDRVPPRDRAEFCRPLLHWLAVLDGNVVVHAGGVGRAGKGLLVAGAGNAGKSTLTRACLAAGFDYLGDNVVEVELPPAGPARLHAVYPTFKIRRNPALPIPADWPDPEWDDEAEKDIYFLGGGSRFAAAPNDHVATLILDETGSTAPQALERAASFFRVAPNTVAQFPFFEETVLKRTGEVVGRAPTFTAGRMPIDTVPDIVAGLLGAARAGVP